MSIVVTCAFKPSWCDFAQERFVDMGIEKPDSAERNSMNVQELLTKMCASQGPTQTATPFQLGRAWEIVTADLFVANAVKPMWGWADRRNIHIMEFLLEFDPNCRFVLVYGSMPELLSEELTTLDLTGRGIDQLVDEWREYHDAMLRFYQMHPERCVLTHISAFEGNARAITDRIISKFGIPVRHTNTSKSFEHSWLETLLASQVSNVLDGDDHLSTELNGSADLPSTNSVQNSIHEVSLAAQEFTTLKNRNAAFYQQIADLEDANQGKDEEIATLSSKLIDAERTLEELEEAGASVAEAENQLLSGQLQQVQRELQLYFGKYQTLKESVEANEKQDQNKNANEVSSTQLDPSGPSPDQEQLSLFIDFRSFIDGDHWHAAEPQGRWAGLRETSVVRIDALKTGTYRVLLRVTDAMSLEHLNSLTIEANGSVAPQRAKILSDMRGRLAPLRRLKARLQKVPKPFPAEVSAVLPEYVTVGNDMPLELVFRTCPPVSPSTVGGTDDRPLSICIESMTLTKVG